MRGEDDDKESGLNHLAHATANLAMLIDLQMLGKGKDDRNPVYQPVDDLSYTGFEVPIAFSTMQDPMNWRTKAGGVIYADPEQMSQDAEAMQQYLHDDTK